MFWSALKRPRRHRHHHIMPRQIELHVFHSHHSHYSIYTREPTYVYWTCISCSDILYHGYLGCIRAAQMLSHCSSVVYILLGFSLFLLTSIRWIYMKHHTRANSLSLSLSGIGMNRTGAWSLFMPAHRSVYTRAPHTHKVHMQCSGDQCYIHDRFNIH